MKYNALKSYNVDLNGMNVIEYNYKEINPLKTESESELELLYD
jgi:hypothetical protein